MITLPQLHQIAPHAPAEHLDAINAAMDEFHVDTPQRAAAFLAQCMFECDQGRQLVEPTDGHAYEFAKRLGNTQPGDGFRYRGRGGIHLTGRDNYDRVGRALGVDLVGSPELAADLRFAYRIAGYYWESHGCNVLADVGDFEGITRQVNGGLNGFQIRLDFWTRALRAYGLAAVCGGEGA